MSSSNNGCNCSNNIGNNRQQQQRTTARRRTGDDGRRTTDGRRTSSYCKESVTITANTILRSVARCFACRQYKDKQENKKAPKKAPKTNKKAKKEPKKSYVEPKMEEKRILAAQVFENGPLQLIREFIQERGHGAISSDKQCTQGRPIDERLLFMSYKIRMMYSGGFLSPHIETMLKQVGFVFHINRWIA